MAWGMTGWSRKMETAFGTRKAYLIHGTQGDRRGARGRRQVYDRFSGRPGRRGVRGTGQRRAPGRLFVTLTETGADGLVPMSMIGDDRFDFDSPAQRIKGRGSGEVFSIGTSPTVRLEEANVHTGSMAFSVVSGEVAVPANGEIHPVTGGLQAGGKVETAENPTDRRNPAANHESNRRIGAI